MSSSSSKTTRSSSSTSDDTTSVMAADTGVELPPLDGPVATTHDEAITMGYFGGPIDDTDYTFAAMATQVVPGS
jgi:hypothetical protein